MEVPDNKHLLASASLVHLTQIVYIQINLMANYIFDMNPYLA